MSDPSQERFLRSLVESKEHGGKFCERCKCCEMLRQECETCCGEGMVDDDECKDACEPCYTCEGDGSWWWCDCSDSGVHTCKTCGGEGHTSLTCKQSSSEAGVQPAPAEGAPRETEKKGGTDHGHE